MAEVFEEKFESFEDAAMSFAEKVATETPEDDKEFLSPDRERFPNDFMEKKYTELNNQMIAIAFALNAFEERLDAINGKVHEAADAASYLKILAQKLKEEKRVDDISLIDIKEITNRVSNKVMQSIKENEQLIKKQQKGKKGKINWQTVILSSIVSAIVSISIIYFVRNNSLYSLHNTKRYIYEKATIKENAIVYCEGIKPFRAKKTEIKGVIEGDKFVMLLELSGAKRKCFVNRSDIR